MYTLNFTEAELAILWQALNTAPLQYCQVAPLIANITNQRNDQQSKKED